jgi:4-hydroxy-3-methylbut-2-enyl diphosphate reductase IspH
LYSAKAQRQRLNGLRKYAKADARESFLLNLPANLICLNWTSENHRRHGCASTPAWIIKEVHKKMNDEFKEMESNEEKSKHGE